MKMSNHNSAAVLKFLDYAARANPAAYKETMRRHGLGCASCGLGDSIDPTLPDYSFSSAIETSGMGDPMTSGVASTPAAQTVATSPATSASWVDTFNKLAPGIVNLFNTNSCTQMNIARAKNGQAAIDCSAVAPTATVGLTSQTSSLVMFGIAAIAGVILLGRRRG